MCKEFSFLKGSSQTVILKKMKNILKKTHSLNYLKNFSICIPAVSQRPWVHVLKAKEKKTGEIPTQPLSDTCSGAHTLGRLWNFDNDFDSKSFWQQGRKTHCFFVSWTFRFRFVENKTLLQLNSIWNFFHDIKNEWRGEGYFLVLAL